MNLPLFYLDQNIVSLQAAGGCDLSNTKSVQWVYSKEHFAEIQRSADPEKFLDALDTLSAKLLDFELVDWKITGKAAVIEQGSARQHYTDYLQATREVVFDNSVFNPLVAWLAGGNYADLVRNMPNAIQEQLDQLAYHFPAHLMPAIPPGLNEEFSKTVENMIAEGNDIRRTREHFGVGKGVAGNISGENKILQLWEMVRPKMQDVSDITADLFFGFEPHSFEREDSIPVYLGIIRCCAVLDILGFHAEQKIRDLDKVDNTRSDATHIAAGAYCAALVSRDRRMVNRAKAIYEYRNIGTALAILELASDKT